MPMRWHVNPLGGEPQLESRMRESRQSGSEGGGAKPIVSPYPYQRAQSVEVTHKDLRRCRRIVVSSCGRKAASAAGAVDTNTA